ncbi:ATP-binding cassette domain-containing protein [bacterium]|nr:ATP-binding cassette domain-containing protein [bacterium]
MTSKLAFRILRAMLEFRLQRVTRHKTYRNNSNSVKTVVALDTVTADICSNCITCILGPSGSGKSTLLRLLNGLESPDDGEIFLGEKPLTDYPPRELRRRVALVPQAPALFDMTVEQNLRFAFLHDIETSQPSAERINDVLQLANLDSSTFLDRPTSALSLGEKQRVMLARALLRSPKVLLLDEPTAALDTKSTAIIESSIRKLNANTKITCIWVTHSPKQAQRLADRILLLKSGKVVFEGSAADAKPHLEELENNLET